MREPEVRPEILRIHQREDLESERREPLREAQLPSRPHGYLREHREGKSRTPQAASLTPNDAAEGVHRRAVRRKPGGMSGGVDHRPREGHHPADPPPPGRTRLLRL